LKIEKETEYEVAVRKNKLFIYVRGPQDQTDEYKKKQSFLMIQNGRVKTETYWKDYPHGELLIIGDGTLFLGNRRFSAPTYNQKKVLPYYSIQDVKDDYDEEHHPKGADET
jgi:hypothetical protein